MKETAVVILNWNGINWLKQFLPTVVKYSLSDADVIVADNNSTDNSISWIKEKHPEVIIIKNEKNYGFAKGYNELLKKLNHKYFILLNSDVEVTKNWIPPLIKLLKEEKTAACQPKLLDYNHKEFFEYAGAAGGFIDKFGFPFTRGRILNEIEKDNGQYDGEKEVFWATGACLAIKANIFKEVNGFDEDFFAHMEEIDLCWRIKNIDYQIKYTSESKVYHVGGGTLNKVKPKKTFLNFRNNLFMLQKNLPNNKLIPILITRLFIDGIGGIKLLFSDGFPHLIAVIKAHFHFYRYFFKNQKKRKLSKPSWHKEIYNKSILFDFFLRNKKKYSQLK